MFCICKQWLRNTVLDIWVKSVAFVPFGFKDDWLSGGWAARCYPPAISARPGFDSRLRCRAIKLSALSFSLIGTFAGCSGGISVKLTIFPLVTSLKRNTSVPASIPGRYKNLFGTLECSSNPVDCIFNLSSLPSLLTYSSFPFTTMLLVCCAVGSPTILIFSWLVYIFHFSNLFLLFLFQLSISCFYLLCVVVIYVMSSA